MENIIRPIKKSYVVTQSYSEHIQYGRANNLKNYNPGIDYVSYYTDKTGYVPLFACGKGVVSKVGFQDGGYGNYVIIRTKDYLALYAHMRYACTLTVGTAVDENTILGYMGSTGFSTGDHVHFETRTLSNSVFDPTQYIVDRETYLNEENKDVTVCKFNNDIYVGANVQVKRNSMSYNGTPVWFGIYDGVYRVDEIFEDRVLLDKNGICTAFHAQDLYLYCDNKNQITKTDEQDEDNIKPHTTYLVQSGDNLWNIAINHDMTLDELLKVNPNITNPNLIFVGQVINLS